jgi:hypothetical protein
LTHVINSEHTNSVRGREQPRKLLTSMTSGMVIAWLPRCDPLVNYRRIRGYALPEPNPDSRDDHLPPR